MAESVMTLGILQDGTQRMWFIYEWWSLLIWL